LYSLGYHTYDTILRPLFQTVKPLSGFGGFSYPQASFYDTWPTELSGRVELARSSNRPEQTEKTAACQEWLRKPTPETAVEVLMRKPGKSDPPPAPGHLVSIATVKPHEAGDKKRRARIYSWHDL
jgi:hypothetical protein